MPGIDDYMSLFWPGASIDRASPVQGEGLTLSTRRHRLSLLAGSLVYSVLLILCYMFIVSPRYSYMGYVLYPVGLDVVVVSIALATWPCMWLPFGVQRPSQAVLWLLYVLVIVPSMVIPVFTVQRNTLVGIHASVLLGFAVLASFQRFPLLRLPAIKQSRVPFWGLLGVVGVLCLYLVLSVFGFRFKLVSFAEVYSLRSDYKEALLANGSAVDYAIHWLGNVIHPTLIALGLRYKRLKWMVAGFVGQLLVYSITGFKSVLFSIVLFAAIMYGLRRNGQRFGFSVIWGMAAVTFVGLSTGLLLSSNYLSFLLTGRLTVTPGLLTGYYFEFFGSNPKAMLGHSVLQGIVEYPYAVTPSFLIGGYYMGNDATNANANFLADAFANFGYFGVFTFSCLLGLVLWVCDSAARGKDGFLPALLLGKAATTLSNAALLTTLFSHGLFLILALVYFLPRRGKEMDNEHPQDCTPYVSSPSNGQPNFP